MEPLGGSQVMKMEPHDRISILEGTRETKVFPSHQLRIEFKDIMSEPKTENPHETPNPPVTLSWTSKFPVVCRTLTVHLPSQLLLASLGPSQADLFVLPGHNLAFLVSRALITQSLHLGSFIHPLLSLTTSPPLPTLPGPPFSLSKGHVLTHGSYFLPPSPCSFLWGTCYFSQSFKFKLLCLALTTLDSWF